MNWQQPELMSSNHTNTSATYNDADAVQKPVEVYLFMDPFSKECWALQSYLKKLTLEYGRFFTVRAIVSGRFSVCSQRKLDAQAGEPMVNESAASYSVTHPWIPSLAIKASELQGKRAGNMFLRKLQEKLFIDKQNISRFDVLLECAEEANLDMREFERDLFSTSAKRAYQCDRRLTSEIDVDTMPTVVFFNQVVEEHGIKVSGLYPYEVYELVLSEILQYHPIPSSKPPLEDLIRRSSIIGTEEIAIIYDWSREKAEHELKKLKLQQIVQKLERGCNTYWKYNV